MLNMSQIIKMLSTLKINPDFAIDVSKLSLLQRNSLAMGENDFEKKLS